MVSILYLTVSDCVRFLSVSYGYGLLRILNGNVLISVINYVSRILKRIFIHVSNQIRTRNNERWFSLLDIKGTLVILELPK